MGSFGYRYVLPVRFTYDAFAEDGVERMRYSFLSLAHAAREGGPAGAPRLVAGEYGRGRRTTRLVDFTLDPATSLLRVSDDGVARPSRLPEQGVQGMQGATVVGGRWYLTTSAGRYPRFVVRRTSWGVPASHRGAAGGRGGRQLLALAGPAAVAVGVPGAALRLRDGPFDLRLTAPWTLLVHKGFGPRN